MAARRTRLMLRAGRATFAEGLKNFGALAGVADLAFVVLPLHAKLRIGVPAMAKIFSQLSDQLSTVEERTVNTFTRFINVRAAGSP